MSMLAGCDEAAGSLGRFEATENCARSSEACDVIDLVASVVEIECGVSPQCALPGSAARTAYRRGIARAEREAAVWRRTAAVRPEDQEPDLYSIAILAAYRACWTVLTGAEARRARYRSQVRCILGFTPGYALWHSGGETMAGHWTIDWVGGRIAWRDEGQLVAPIPSLGCAEKLRRLRGHQPPRFDDVRAAVFWLIDQVGAPVEVEALVAALEQVSGTTEEPT